MRASRSNRQFARIEVNADVELTVCDSCIEQIAPINGSQISGRITNISGGGGYILLPTFLPRETLVDLELPKIDDIPPGTVRARVVKVRMTDREPTYGVGIVFEDDASPLVQLLQQRRPVAAGPGAPAPGAPAPGAPAPSAPAPSAPFVNKPRSLSSPGRYRAPAFRPGAEGPQS